MPILHKNITATDDIHNPKWFTDSNNGDYAWKNELGILESIDELVLPPALEFVDASVAPPTSNTGDIYVLSSGGSVDAGWGSVSIKDWVRYDGTNWNSITPQKSSLCYDKNTNSLQSFDGLNWVAIAGGIDNGTTAEKVALSPSEGDFFYDTDLQSLQRYNGSDWVDISKGYGVCFINDSNGVPTFYSDLTTAFAATSAGDTVFMSANITETGNVTITIPNEVNFNLNGFTYTLDGSDNSAFVKQGVLTKTKIINGTIIKQNSPTPNGGGSGLEVGQSAEIDCTGLTVISDGDTVLDFNTAGSGQGRVFNGIYIYNGTNTVYSVITEGVIEKAIIVTGTGALRVTGDGLYNSTVFGAVATTSSGVLKDCIINNTSSTLRGLELSGAKAFNCNVYSQNTGAIYLNNAVSECHDSKGVSDGGRGIDINTGKAFNSKGISTFTVGLFVNQATATASFCMGESTAASGIELRVGTLLNCNGISNFNDPAGHGIFVGNNNGYIIDCTGITTNTSAHALQAGTVNRNCYIVNLKGKGMTTLIGSKAINIQTNTPDSFNNILIG